MPITAQVLLGVIMEDVAAAGLMFNLVVVMLWLSPCDGVQRWEIRPK